jgi:hypothetical protein
VESSGEKVSITAVSIYKDLSGLPKVCVSDKGLQRLISTEVEQMVKTEPAEKMEGGFDDIDALLYGSDKQMGKI